MNELPLIPDAGEPPTPTLRPGLADRVRGRHARARRRTALTAVGSLALLIGAMAWWPQPTRPVARVVSGIDEELARIDITADLPPARPPEVDWTEGLDRAAAALLVYAETLDRQMNDAPAAAREYRRIVEQFPESNLCNLARTRLSELSTR
ncbi:MAG: hypothetical protein K1X57_14895 [Gemmataceae bacterium]|nr:hypothetical protein [Gemmataceae bacterium]